MSKTDDLDGRAPMRPRRSDRCFLHGMHCYIAQETLPKKRKPKHGTQKPKKRLRRKKGL